MSRRYRLGMALARLGDVVVSQIALRDVAMPVLRDLTAATGQTSRVAVLDESYAIVIGRVDDAGQHGPLHREPRQARAPALLRRRQGDARRTAREQAVHRILATAGMPGKTSHTITDEAALLAELEGVARHGYAIDDEEDAEGVFCVGSAVFDHSAGCVGAVSVTGLKLDLPAWRIEQLGQIVARAREPDLDCSLGAVRDETRARRRQPRLDRDPGTRGAHSRPGRGRRPRLPTAGFAAPISSSCAARSTPPSCATH